MQEYTISFYPLRLAQSKHKQIQKHVLIVFPRIYFPKNSIGYNSFAHI